MTSPPVPAQAITAAVTREDLGRIVRRVWVEWAFDQPEAESHPSWLLTWSELDAGQREVDMRIGEAVAAAERAKLQQVLNRVTRLATAAQEKAVEAAVGAERERCAQLAETAGAICPLPRPMPAVTVNGEPVGDTAGGAVVWPDGMPQTRPFADVLREAQP